MGTADRRGFLALMGLAVAAAAAGHAPARHAGRGHGGTALDVTAAPATPHAARVAIGYARAQAGKPYLWGGTGPDAYDCSGLVMEAWAAAGVAIPRTSEAQWAQLPHVASPRPGDLVFFPGSDGSWQAPGHVGLVVRPGVMIQAYATGWNIGTWTYGHASSLPGTGPGDVIGFARPD